MQRTALWSEMARPIVGGLGARLKINLGQELGTGVELDRELSCRGRDTGAVHMVVHVGLHVVARV